jgi:predicted RNA-binding protein YlqC (UPF0109 family)
MNDGEEYPLEDHALALEMVRAVVDEPGRVKVTYTETDAGDRRYVIWVAYPDIAKLVRWNNGRTLRAVRDILQAIGDRENRKIDVQVRRLNTE